MRIIVFTGFQQKNKLTNYNIKLSCIDRAKHGNWRDHEKGSMKVVSGAMGKRESTL